MSRSVKGARGSAVALVVAFVSAMALVAISPQSNRAQECLLVVERGGQVDLVGAVTLDTNTMTRTR